MNVAIITMSYTCFTSLKNNKVTEQRQIHSISLYMFNECVMATVEYKVQKAFINIVVDCRCSAPEQSVVSTLQSSIYI